MHGCPFAHIYCTKAECSSPSTASVRDSNHHTNIPCMPTAVAWDSVGCPPPPHTHTPLSPLGNTHLATTPAKLTPSCCQYQTCYAMLQPHPTPHHTTPPPHPPPTTTTPHPPTHHFNPRPAHLHCQYGDAGEQELRHLFLPGGLQPRR